MRAEWERWTRRVGEKYERVRVSDKAGYNQVITSDKGGNRGREGEE